MRKEIFLQNPGPEYLHMMTKPHRKIRRPEQELQKAVYKYISYAAPHVLCFHVPNGGKRSKIEASIFKAMGVMPGVADLLLFWRDRKDPVFSTWTYHAAIELKSDKGTATLSQITFSDRWQALGGKYAVCRSIDDVEAALKQWEVIA